MIPIFETHWPTCTWHRRRSLISSIDSPISLFLTYFPQTSYNILNMYIIFTCPDIYFLCLGCLSSPLSIWKIPFIFDTIVACLRHGLQRSPLPGIHALPRWRGLTCVIIRYCGNDGVGFPRMGHKRCCSFHFTLLDHLLQEKLAAMS